MGCPIVHRGDKLQAYLQKLIQSAKVWIKLWTEQYFVLEMELEKIQGRDTSHRKHQNTPLFTYDMVSLRF